MSMTFVHFSWVCNTTVVRPPAISMYSPNVPSTYVVSQHHHSFFGRRGHRLKSVRFFWQTSRRHPSSAFIPRRYSCETAHQCGRFEVSSARVAHSPPSSSSDSFRLGWLSTCAVLLLVIIISIHITVDWHCWSRFPSFQLIHLCSISLEEQF